MNKCHCERYHFYSHIEWLTHISYNLDCERCNGWGYTEETGEVINCYDCTGTGIQPIPIITEFKK